MVRAPPCWRSSHPARRARSSAVGRQPDQRSTMSTAWPERPMTTNTAGPDSIGRRVPRRHPVFSRSSHASSASSDPTRRLRVRPKPFRSRGANDGSFVIDSSCGASSLGRLYRGGRYHFRLALVYGRRLAASRGGDCIGKHARCPDLRADPVDPSDRILPGDVRTESARPTSDRILFRESRGARALFDRSLADRPARAA